MARCPVRGSRGWNPRRCAALAPVTHTGEPTARHPPARVRRSPSGAPGRAWTVPAIRRRSPDRTRRFTVHRDRPASLNCSSDTAPCRCSIQGSCAAPTIRVLGCPQRPGDNARATLATRCGDAPRLAPDHNRAEGCMGAPMTTIVGQRQSREPGFRPRLWRREHGCTPRHSCGERPDSRTCARPGPTPDAVHDGHGRGGDTRT